MLKASLSRANLSGAGRDPVVNGFTRTAKGFIGKQIGSAFIFPDLSTGGSFDQKMVNNLPSVYLQSNAVLGKDGGGYYLWNTGVRLTDNNFSQIVLTDVVTTLDTVGPWGTISRSPDNVGYAGVAMEIYGGNIRVWGDRHPMVNTPYAPVGPFGFSVFANNSGNQLYGKGGTMPNVSYWRRFDIEYQNCIPSGSVSASINGGAAIVSAIDGDGSGLLPIPDSVSFPCSIAYTIKDSSGAIKAQFTIPVSGGGDVIGTVSKWVPPSGPFTPLSLRSTTLWLRPENIVGASGATVNAWPDATANARDFVKHSTLAAPVVAPAAINGHPLIRFDGAARSLQRADATLRSQTMCWFFVFKFNALTTGGVFSVMPGADNGFNVNYNGAGKTLTGHSGGGYDYYTTNQNDTNLHVLCIQHDDAHGTTKVYLDGALISTGAHMVNTLTPNASIGTFYAGTDMNSPAIYANFDIGEIVACGKVLSDADRASVIGYLKTKWGIA